MNLVLFEFAVDHMIRINRILRMDQGHALLVGLGGSGRQSLTKLTAHIREYSLFQVEIQKNFSQEMWKELMQNLLKQVGLDQKETVFLISDS